jgi:signal peptidase I
MIRRAGRGLRLAATAGVLIIWAVLLRPQVLGGPADYVVVRGDSMLPTYRTGDLVVAQAASSYEIGDVIAYRVPAGELGAGRLVIHRIVGGDATAGFVVEGDNNPAPDPWSPRGGDIAGRAVLAIPDVGRAMTFLHQPAAVGAIAVAILVGVTVARRPRDVEVAVKSR